MELSDAQKADYEKLIAGPFAGDCMVSPKSTEAVLKVALQNGVVEERVPGREYSPKPFEHSEVRDAIIRMSLLEDLNQNTITGSSKTYIQINTEGLSILAQIVNEPDPYAPEHALLLDTLEEVYGDQYEELRGLMAIVASNYKARLLVETDDGKESDIRQRLNQLMTSPEFQFTSSIRGLIDIIDTTLESMASSDAIVWEDIRNLNSAFSPKET